MPWLWKEPQARAGEQAHTSAQQVVALLSVVPTRTSPLP